LVGGAKELVLELAGQFTVNGKPTSAYISYTSFDFYKNCPCTSDLGNNRQKNVALEECSISEIMYAYSHTRFHIWRTGVRASIYPEHANKLCHESLMIFCF
jgi:hypothetical protein